MKWDKHYPKIKNGHQRINLFGLFAKNKQTCLGLYIQEKTKTKMGIEGERMVQRQLPNRDSFQRVMSTMGKR